MEMCRPVLFDFSKHILYMVERRQYDRCPHINEMCCHTTQPQNVEQRNRKDRYRSMIQSLYFLISVSRFENILLRYHDAFGISGSTGGMHNHCSVVRILNAPDRFIRHFPLQMQLIHNDRRDLQTLCGFQGFALPPLIAEKYSGFHAVQISQDLLLAELGIDHQGDTAELHGCIKDSNRICTVGHQDTDLLLLLKRVSVLHQSSQEISSFEKFPI